MPMLQYSIASKTCVGLLIYGNLNPGVSKFAIEYTNPLIAGMFLDDEEFVRFCENYDYYTSLNPIFSDPKTTTKWCLETGWNWLPDRMESKDYPVMHLGDVEIHWIHESNKNVCLRKFLGRLELDKKINNKIFVWSDAEMYNNHDRNKYEELIFRYLKIKYRSIYLTIDQNLVFNDENHVCFPVPEWKNYNLTEKDSYNFITWNNQTHAASIFTNIIKNLGWV